MRLQPYVRTQSTIDMSYCRIELLWASVAHTTHEHRFVKLIFMLCMHIMGIIAHMKFANVKDYSIMSQKH